MKFKFNMPKVEVNGLTAWIIAVLIILAAVAVSCLFVAGVVWVICFAFGFEWSWTLSLGVFAVIVLLRYVFSAASSSSK